ncbi:LapA family protein [Shewanella youngdeokensis]|uniref:Probable lipopolysaccharide assembly protein A n=1 Tax=Shewanella youngdeokensis TaxID=2999068 RepID=A0ABZ0K4G2_9GAMM|nr:lipopolysaccharide assembly protein LapA domain-containing protein [Shewanella sp. DAU334]
MKSFIIAVIVAAFFLIALIFGARNEQVVTISYFVAQGEFRLPVVLAVVFLAGFLVSWLFAMYHITGLKFTIRRLKKQLAIATNNVDTKKSDTDKPPLETTEKEVEA